MGELLMGLVVALGIIVLAVWVNILLSEHFYPGVKIKRCRHK
jgi:hypothetical protein